MWIKVYQGPRRLTKKIKLENHPEICKRVVKYDFSQSPFQTDLDYRGRIFITFLNNTLFSVLDSYYSKDRGATSIVVHEWYY